jgi:hypothetical protein
MFINVTVCQTFRQGWCKRGFTLALTPTLVGINSLSKLHPDDGIGIDWQVDY